MTDSSPLVRPSPRRPFPLTWTSTSTGSSPAETPTRENLLGVDQETSRTRSFLNLTSSTLLGIYSPSVYDSGRGESSTPWGTGTHTPLRMPNIVENRPILLPKSDAFLRPGSSGTSLQTQFGFRNTLLPIIERTIVLFLFGVGYGLIITHLHDEQRLAPVPVENIVRNSWHYLTLWGTVGVCLGELLPWIDILWNETKFANKDLPESMAMPETPKPSSGSSDEDVGLAPRSRSRLIADWNPAIRGIGAFIGVAFAIRKLPWQSTLQVSLTLALVNPVLWYLIDRSKPGFILSAFVSITGTAVLLGMNPEMVPMPSASPRASATANSHDTIMHHGLISSESIGVWTWIASVLFCSSLCFGNIGRRLATGQSGLKSKFG